jgi:hypothetical protein
MDFIGAWPAHALTPFSRGRKGPYGDGQDATTRNSATFFSDKNQLRLRIKILIQPVPAFPYAKPHSFAILKRSIRILVDQEHLRITVDGSNNIPNLQSVSHRNSKW